MAAVVRLEAVLHVGDRAAAGKEGHVGVEEDCLVWRGGGEEWRVHARRIMLHAVTGGVPGEEEGVGLYLQYSGEEANEGGGEGGEEEVEEAWIVPVAGEESEVEAAAALYASITGAVERTPISLDDDDANGALGNGEVGNGGNTLAALERLDNLLVSGEAGEGVPAQFEDAEEEGEG